MHDTVDHVELGCYEPCEPCLVVVVDTASTLNDVDTTLQETPCDPSKCVGVRVMIRVVKGDDIAPVVEREVVVDVVGLGCRVGHLDNTQSGMCLLQLAQLGLDWLDRLGCVVDEIDHELVARIVDLPERISELAHDDLLFVWEVSYQDDVDLGPGLAILGLAPTLLGCLAKSASGLDRGSNGLHCLGGDGKRCECLKGKVDVEKDLLKNRWDDNVEEEAKDAVAGKEDGGRPAIDEGGQVA